MTFKIPEVEIPPEYDGHTPDIAALRLERFLNRDYKNEEEA